MLNDLPSGRVLAATVLVRVLRDKAWIAPTLTAELDRYPQLEARERGLATELVYGTTRAHLWLLRALTERTKTKTIDDEVVLAHMLIAAYQALLLDRIPVHAAIDAAVGSIRQERDPHVAGFANAVLRRVVREVPRPEPIEVALASVPRWLRERTEKSIGKEAARAFFAHRQELPPVALRVHDPAQTETWAARLAEASPDASFTLADLPGCILAKGAGRLESLPGFGESWAPQDYGSLWIAQAVRAMPGDRVLDACAGRGQKTGVLARAVSPTGAVDAADLHPKKLATMEAAAAEQGFSVRTFSVDWTQGTGDATGPYDRVLVDAPCSGTGTLGRRPEILLRLTERDLPDLRQKQIDITTRVASLVKPGGVLVYSVCSVLREEAEQVIDKVRENVPELEVVNTFRILPPEKPSDGYFVATLRRTK